MAVERADTTLFDTIIPDDVYVKDHALLAFRERKASHLAALNQLDQCQADLMQAAALLTSTLRSGHTVLTLGNGGSAAEAQHFAAELVGRFRLERRAYPVLALTTDSSILTAIANDYSFAGVFSRQVEAFAGPGDLLVAFSTSGESENAIQAARVAKAQGATVIGMTGARDGSLGRWADVVVQVPATDTPTIQEVHSMFTHVLCDVAESVLARVDGGSAA